MACEPRGPAGVEGDGTRGIQRIRRAGWGGMKSGAGGYFLQDHAEGVQWYRKATDQEDQSVP